MIDFLSFILGTVGTLLILWLIGSFITWDLLWFMTTIYGRIIALILTGITFYANVEENNL